MMVTDVPVLLPKRNQVPLLGPNSFQADAEVWGLDLYGLRAKYSSEGALGGYSNSLHERLVVSNPRHVFALMSYCNTVTRDLVQSTWLGATTHQRILAYIDRH